MDLRTLGYFVAVAVRELEPGAVGEVRRADRVRTRAAAAAGPATLTVGTLADSVEQTGARLAAAYRQRHPGVRVRIREADLADPTAGLRSGLVDVALTRGRVTRQSLRASMGGGAAHRRVEG